MKRTMKQRQIPARCRICGCTQERACPAGCGWAPDEGDLCTVCASFRNELEEYFGQAAGVSNASLIRLWKEVQKRLGLQ
jgi:hypothetical protein